MKTNFKIISLQYCITTWGGASETALSPLERLHKRAIRTMTGSNWRAHSLPLFEKMKMLKMKDIYKIEIAKIMYRVMTSSYLTEEIQFKEITNQYNTRLSKNKNFVIPRVRTQLGKKSLSVTGPRIWQEVPIEIKMKSNTIFKRLYKSFLISKYVDDA